MHIERRALYNSLRMNWVLDPTMEVEPWQVEDYRTLPLDTIFERLEDKDIHLEKTSFVAFAENVDSPEEFTDELVADYNLETSSEDQIYLLIFELWRRLLPEKPCLSVFCDELDYQIHLYDRGHAKNAEAIQDIIANLEVILDENADEGADPLEVFDGINASCANDIESFLHDYISEQIDNHNYSYAAELLDGFMEYVPDSKWFDFLRERLLAATDPEGANHLLKELIDTAAKNPDLEFNLELMAFLVQGGEEPVFKRLLELTIPLIEFEEDFQDVLTICADFYHYLDRENVEKAIQDILKTRSNHAKKNPFDLKDPQIAELFRKIE